jgi:NTP pyrophosphatase (non-canonical NTP hydrolase)
MDSAVPDQHSGDPSTTVAALRELVRRFVDERNWRQFHNPKNLAMSLAIETGELMEHFQWLSLEASAAVQHDDVARSAVEEELADCFAYILALANTMEIDLSRSLRAKMIKNAEKYPAQRRL